MNDIRALLTLLILLFVVSCTSMERSSVDDRADVSGTVMDQFFNSSELFERSTTGFVLYDPDADSVLHNRDGHRFFTPASNMKLFTLYGALKTLPEMLPTLKYTVRNDTIYFRGTGDPTFLNPEFEHQTAYEFLKMRDEVPVYFNAHFTDQFFGSGWPWDWHSAAYAPEKTPFPIYGNMMRLQAQQVALIMLNEDQPVKPVVFEQYIKNLGWDGPQSELVKRELRNNTVLYQPRSDTVRHERNIPFMYSNSLMIDLLSDTLATEVYQTERNDIEFLNTFYGGNSGEAYKRMMLQSDNFIAEQLLLMISDAQFGEMNTEKAIQYILDDYLGFLPDPVRWSDGSGLTRYNLTTPMSIVRLIDQIRVEYGEELLLSMLPAGGGEGTLSGWFRTPNGVDPYVYAKTGTLRNNTSLSGVIFTDSGKRYIFSFLNNNYVASNNAMRAEMEKALQLIKENF